MGTRQMCATAKDREELSAMGIIPIESNLIDVSDKMIRHDAGRIANIIMSLIHEA